jgi:oligoendopeptidase F
MKCIPAFLAASFLAASATGAEAPYLPDANAPRASVPERYRWDLSIFFKSDADWDAASEEAMKALPGISRHQGKLSSAAAIKACLDDYFSLRRAFDKAGFYAQLRAVEDAGDSRAQGMQRRSLDMFSEFRARTSFIRQELLAPEDGAMKGILGDAALSSYKRYVLDLRRRRSRILGPEAERVLGLAADNLWSEVDLDQTPSDVDLAFKAALKDVEFPVIKDEAGREVRLNLSNYPRYRASKDPRVRLDCVNSFLGTLKKHEDTFAATLAAEAKRDVFLARARGYPRSVDAYLDRLNIPASVAESLVASVRANLAPLHRYVALRKRLLKLKELRLGDLYAPLVPGSDMRFPYEEGLKEIVAAVQPLGPAYASALTGPDMLGRRFADVYPNKGKDSGAFSIHLWGYPPMVKLNYMDEIDDLSTAIHEFGHAMHSRINLAAQGDPDCNYAPLIGEIASTFNEMLLSKHLLGKYKNDDRLRLCLLGDLVEKIRTTIYRQAMFTEFELKLHAFAEQGVPITADLLGKTYAGIARDYYGPDFTLGENDGVEWSYIPHFYYKHYVFSYACGLASAIALSEKVASGDAAARDRYLAMLAKPREDAPVDILREAGVDLTKPDAVDDAAEFMDKALSEVEALAGKLSL